MSRAADGTGRGTWLVLERELREAFRHKALWITAAVAILGTTTLMLLPSLLGGGGDVKTVAVVGEAPAGFADALRTTAGALDLTTELTTAADDDSARAAVRNGDADAAVDLGADALLITKQRDSTLAAALRQAIAGQRTVAALRDAGLDDATIAQVLAAPAVRLDVIDGERNGRIAAAAIVSIAVYLLLFIVTMQVANGVAIEKANRVSEVLLAIVPPRSLLYGKVLGVGMTALLPLAAGATPVVVKLILNGDLPPATGAALAAGAAWFVLGAGCYLLAAGALGALVERQEEAGSSVGGLSVCLVGSYLIGQTAADSPLGTVLAYLPFSSPMVEPARLALGVSSSVEVIGSLAVSLATLFAMAKLAATIYRRAVVHTGRRLRLREALRPTQKVGPAPV